MSCNNCNQTTLPVTTISGPAGSNGQNGARGLYGGVCSHFQFSASTSGADPGPGLLSFDSSLLSLSTHLYINYLDIVGTNLAAYIGSLNAPNNAVKALIRVTSVIDESLFALFEINDVTALAAYADLSVTYLDGNSNPFAAGDDILFCPALSGNAGAFNFSTISPDFTTGIDYPVASSGDVFRVLTPGWIGTTTAQEPPNSIRVYKDDLLYCLSGSTGGSQSTAGADFFVFSAPRAFVPISTTNGDSNFSINAPGLASAPNNIGSGTNKANGFIGYNNNVSSSSSYNWITGPSHILIGASYNNVTGDSHILRSGSTGNSINGSSSDVTGSNNNVSGYGHIIIGSYSHISGLYNGISASSSATDIRVGMFGAGALAKWSDTVYIGGNTSVGSLSTRGVNQTMITTLSGAISDVTYPAIQTLGFSTNINPVNNDSLSYVDNGLAHSIQGSFIIVQKAVGANNPNTSTVGDWVEFVFSAVVRRSVGGGITLTGVKFLDHRNRWIPTTTPKPISYRNRFVFDGTQADICLVRPSVSISGNNLIISTIFPGFAEVMSDNGDGTTPQFSYYLDSSDVPMPIINTGVAADDGIVKDTITTTAAPIDTATFRNPYVDIFDGNDADGTGFYGGVGVGATATAVTTTTGIASISISDGGSYNNITATISFAFGDATATAIMSSDSDHIGNNVGFTPGNYTGVPNGNYSFVFTGGTGTGAAGYATITGGIVTATTITNGGTGYSTGDVVTLTIPSAVPATVAAVFTPTLYWSVTGAIITAPGVLYRNTSSMSITFAGAGLSQAAGIAHIIPAPITDAGGETGSITVDTGGKGYGIQRPNVAVYDAGGIAFDEGNGGDFIATGTLIISQVKFV